MRVVNAHERSFAAPAGSVGALLDSLASDHDRLWPRRDWPPMVVKGGLVVGSAAGHGPIRYVVDRVESGRIVAFRFTWPRGWTGTHTFSVRPVDQHTATMNHVLEMEATGSSLLAWLLVFRPLHDALIEDALHRAGVELGAPAGERPEWSPYVRLLRRVLRPRGRGGRLPA